MSVAVSQGYSKEGQLFVCENKDFETFGTSGYVFYDQIQELWHRLHTTR